MDFPTSDSILHQRQQLPPCFPIKCSFTSQYHKTRRFTHIGASALTAINQWSVDPDPAIRSTLTLFPDSDRLLRQCHLPLGLIVQPFSSGSVMEIPAEASIPRCRACRAYINPFVTFIDRYRWTCNVCRHLNNTPEDFDPIERDSTTLVGLTTSSGISQVCTSDQFGVKRPYALLHSAEFNASVDNLSRPPVPAIYVFVFEISQLALKSNYFHTLCDVLLQNLKQLPGDRRKMISLIAFDSSVHFFRLDSATGEFERLTSSDLASDEPFLPFKEELIYNVEDNYELIRNLLTSLPAVFHDGSTMNNRCAAGSALECAINLIKYWGGRVSLFLAQDPDCGRGVTTTKSTNQNQPFKYSTDFYKILALQCADALISVDLFRIHYHASEASHLYDICLLPKYSGGTVYGFDLINNPEVELCRFKSRFIQYLTRPIGFDCVIRIRCTRAIEVASFFGDFFVRSTDLLACPIIHSETSFGLQLQFDDDLSEGLDFVSVQIAILFTSPQAIRRIRVHTYVIPIGHSVDGVVEGADPDAIAALIARMAVDRSCVRDLKAAREGLTSVGSDLLRPIEKRTRRFQCGLYMVHLYLLGLLKSRTFTTRPSVSNDDRVCMGFTFSSSPTRQILRIMYPMLYRLYIEHSHDLQIKRVAFSPMIGLTSANIGSEFVHLLVKGDVVHIIPGSHVDQLLVSQCFGHLSPCQPCCSVPIGKTFVDAVGLSVEAQNLTFVLCADASKYCELFVDDNSPDSMSLAEFFAFVQNETLK